MLGTAGVIGIALGFAFKDTLENHLAGVLMSLRQPFAPCDLVVIDGQEGTVVALTSRATILMTPDGNHLRLPSALVFCSVMLNHTRNPSRRFEFDVGMGVQKDLIRAQLIGTDELRRLTGVMIDLPPRALIQTLGDSNVQLRFRGWVDQQTQDSWAVRSETIRMVKLLLEAAGMDMPEPIYQVQLSQPLSATHTKTSPACRFSPGQRPRTRRTRCARPGCEPRAAAADRARTSGPRPTQPARYPGAARVMLGVMPEQVFQLTTAGRSEPLPSHTTGPCPTKGRAFNRRPTPSALPTVTS